MRQGYMTLQRNDRIMNDKVWIGEDMGNLRGNRGHRVPRGTGLGNLVYTSPTLQVFTKGPF